MILKGEFSSELLKTTANLQFMIPDEGEGPYKVIYLLHGLHGNHSSWIHNSMLPYYGKKYNAIFVMPDAARSFYTDLRYGRNYLSYLSDELPQICRNIFNISTRMEDTAVMGYSMGGYGALRLALSNPGVYGFCGAISTACLYFKPFLKILKNDPDSYLKTGREAEETYKDLLSIYGYDFEYTPAYDILHLIKTYPDNIPKPRIYANCGTEDGLLKENHNFREDMKDSSFDFTYEEWQGGHDWDFFNDGLKKTLEIWDKG
ncbi:MAG: esterase family protein [Treponema sp.]|nr:esterase family protein [Treponema sp.]